MSLALLSAAALAGYQLPPGEVQGPPATQAVIIDDSQRIADAQWRRDTNTAWRKFWVAQGLAAADIGLTCAILADGGREMNPIYGKDATCGRIAAIRGGIAVLQYFLARRAIESDPHKAGKAFNVVIAVQGVPVIWNLVQLAR